MKQLFENVGPFMIRTPSLPIDLLIENIGNSDGIDSAMLLSGSSSNNNSFTYEVKCEGCGEGTMKVVNTAIELAKKAKRSSQPFDSVWSVFDKDNFTDFNAAINTAENNNINVAWSNEE